MITGTTTGQDGNALPLSRRKLLDHERYLRERDVRLARQRAYYRAHTAECKASVARSRKKRVERLKCELWGCRE